MPRIARSCVLAGVLAGAGCGYLESRRGAEGIFDVLFYQPSPLEAAVMADNPYDANDRYRGTLLLANAPYAGERVYIELFERRIADPDANVRTAGARGLANHGEPRHVPLLLAALAEDDPLVRREAARGLQRLHSPAAVGPLIAALRRPDIAGRGGESEREVRTEAALALGQYAENRVLDALISALDDPSLAVNYAALTSLRTLTGQDFGLSRRDWAAWERSAQDRFAQRRPYRYPVFNRAKHFYEYFPFVPDPPNEVPGPPAGMPASER